MLCALPTQNYDDFIIWAQDRGKMSALRQELAITVPQQVTLIKACVFRYYAREVVGNPITEGDVTMMGEARNLLSLVNNDRGGFTTALDSYTVRLQEWLLSDKPRVAYPFATKFNQLRKLRAEIDKSREYYISELKQLVDMTHLQLIGMIHVLGGEEVLGMLDATLEETPLDEVLVANFHRDAATAFWGTFQERLPSYLPVVHLLVDFLHRYCRLDQDNARKRLLVEESLDVEFIKQQIETRTVSDEQLRGYLRIALDATKAISAQVDEPQLEERFGSLITADNEPFIVIRDFFQALFPYYDDLTQRVAAAAPNPVAYGVAAAIASV